MPLRVLVAEDIQVNQKLALRFLEGIGYRADVAGNGIEALEALARQRYDVVFMDVQMPEMDGLAATREIHRRWGTSRPRIIAMTANAMQGDRELCLAAGMDDYITKPLRRDDIEEALRRSFVVHRARAVRRRPKRCPRRTGPRPGRACRPRRANRRGVRVRAR